MASTKTHTESIQELPIGYASFDIVRQKDPISKTTWTFVLRGTTFVLETYIDQYKILPSKNWRTKSRYDRVDGEDNSIDAEQIPIPDDVKEELIKTFTESLTIKIWN